MVIEEKDILPDNEGPLDQRFYEQTAMVLWSELERHFARGIVLHVSPTLDLVDVAISFTDDNSGQVKAWMEAGLLGNLSDTQASHWAKEKPIIWSVVVAPWILAQENEPAKTYPGKQLEQ
ncbi:MAG: DUF2288 domain-containing protein [Proteobacteria bacterium]|nr:DUF2288 domain-containing protein [Pseudomonadota bacterium]